MSVPKRHHYLPQSYLDGFTSRGYLWVFDRKDGEFRRQTPRNTAVESDFYTVLNEDGSKDTALESALAAVDGAAVEAIRNLEETHSLSVSHKRTLALFVALLRIRTPEFAKQHAQLQKTAAAVAADHLSKGAAAVVYHPPVHRPDDPPPTTLTRADLDRLRAVLESDDATLREDALISIPSLAVDLSQILFEMNWVFYIPGRGSYFMTCDNPFWILPTEEGPAGIATPGARKVVPLSKSILLSVHDGGEGYAWSKMPRKAVEGVNCVFALYSDRFLISPRDYSLRKVVHVTRVGRFRRRGRVGVG